MSSSMASTDSKWYPTPSQGWQGEEAAAFVSERCDLPQYAATTERNLSLSTLRELRVQKLLSKGLSRAGICELPHQSRIGKELCDLEAGLPPELLDGRQHLMGSTSASSLATTTASEFLSSRHVWRKGPRVSKQRNSSLTCDVKMRVHEPLQTFTATKLIKRASSAGSLAPDIHSSIDRRSPSPFDMGPILAAQRKG
eukprot:TRINITY_DN6089_c0_g1_i2.p1 TRINITY_DN6089_c0_g1~~TRINITY_DN6089_c0_g1_i2.p1  ORF type:complete len:197 (-),score=33.22 TRINITY_DN6089_c0_g1_i2:91-681(-)